MCANTSFTYCLSDRVVLFLERDILDFIDVHKNASKCLNDVLHGLLNYFSKLPLI